jgi:hypothetical protein
MENWVRPRHSRKGAVTGRHVGCAAVANVPQADEADEECGDTWAAVLRRAWACFSLAM